MRFAMAIVKMDGRSNFHRAPLTVVRALNQRHINLVTISFLLGRIDMTTSTIAQGRRSATRRCLYQNQDSDMTLAEAVAEYYAANTGRVLRPSDLSEESAELFCSHDMCQVIFGLDTTLRPRQCAYEHD
ncbi:MAG: hypothetical protein M3Z96_06020 [Pseudomonadota bacterium]|nr:hypothetical protein [Pseudomonadota bacterium]